MLCTGSSTMTNRNGLSSAQLRGRNVASPRACISPWLVTPSAVPLSEPSTLTGNTTRRRVLVPARVTVPSSTLLS